MEEEPVMFRSTLENDMLVEPQASSSAAASSTEPPRIAKRPRDPAAEAEAQMEEEIARVRDLPESNWATGIEYMGRGPPWHDDVTGALLKDAAVRTGMQAERQCLIEFGVFEEVNRESLPPGAKVVGTRWVLRGKNDGSVKCRLVARQIHKKGVWADAVAATPTSVGQRIVIMECNRRGHELVLIDVKTAF
jgi:hypothetical protein